MNSRALAPLGLLLAAACLAPSPEPGAEPGAGSQEETRGPSQPVREVRQGELTVEDVRRALDQGDLEAAHAALTTLLAKRSLREARALLEGDSYEEGWAALERALELAPRNREALALRRDTAGRYFEVLLDRARAALDDGRPEDALVYCDQALELGPDDGRLANLRGRGFFDLGRKVQDASFLEDSLAAYRDAAARFDSVDAWLGASRAAYHLARTDEALEFAREARERLAPRPDPAALRTIAESVFGAYRAERSAHPESDDCNALFAETEDVLYQLIGEAPETAWAYRELSNLMSWHGYAQEARLALEQGLAQAPDDAPLHARFREVTLPSGGNEELLAFYEDFARRHPAIAVGRFEVGRARFDRAVERLVTRPEGDEGRAEMSALVEEFRAAEADFRRARELDAAYEESALGYEVVARDGRGWCHFHLGELDAARDAFLSMEDLVEGGLRWELKGSLPSGVVSLEFVAGAFFASQQDASMSDLEKAHAMEKAAKVFDFLHEYEPDEVKWANNSGFFNRDVAVMLHDEARNLEAKLEREDLADDEATRLAAEGCKMLARARELMEKSYRAYVDTAKLAPDDVRIVNDTGLILTYYLQRDLGVAEDYLMRAVRLGEEQLRDDSLEPDARYELENALGDAYQNLGVLHLELTGRAAEAKAWLEKSLAIGPDPRPAISRELMPRCDAVLAGELTAPLVNDTNRWTRPFREPEKP